MPTTYNLRKLIICLALMTISVAVTAQSSFQKRIPIDTAWATYIVQLEDSSYVMAIQTFLSGLVLCVDKDGEPRWGLEINHDYLLLTIEELSLDHDGNILIRIYCIADQRGYHDLIKITPNGDVLWRVPLFDHTRVWNSYDNALAVSPNNQYLSCDSQSGSLHECTLINSNGDHLWSKSIKVGSVSKRTTTCALNNGNFIIGLELSANETLLIIINSLGQFVESFTVPLHSVTIMEIQDQDLIIFGSTETNRKNITRVTLQGQTVWSKNIEGAQYAWSNHMSNRGNEIILTFKKLEGPQSILHIDSLGNLIKSISIPIYSRIIGGTTATHDNGLALLASPNINIHPKDAIITKLTDTYSLSGCDVIPNCFSLSDTIINMGPGVDVLITDVTIEEIGDITIDPYPFITEDYCATFKYPDPVFEIPDTICLGTCIEPDQLSQLYADSWTWTAEGFLPDTSNMQKPGFFCPKQAGTYLITQMISLAGCVDSFSHSITILHPPLLTVSIDSVICPFQQMAIPLPPEAILRELTLPDGSIQNITGDTLYLGPFDQDACFSLKLGNPELCDTIIPFCIMVQTPFITLDTIYRCEGNPAVVHGDTLFSPGIYTRIFDDSHGCDSTSTVVLIHTTSPHVTAEAFMPTCADGRDGMIILSGNPGLSYLWNDGNTEGMRTDLSAGTWQVTVSEGVNCDTIISFLLVSPMAFTVELPAQIPLPPGGTVQLLPIVQPPGNYMYSWSPATGLSCTECLSSKASPTETMEYTLVVIDEQGCQQIAGVLINIVHPDEIASKLFIPTAFSPNGDGINDTWQFLSGEEVFIKNISIFERWGGLVFQCQDGSSSLCTWDGKWRGNFVMPGTYVWHATIQVLGYGTIERKGEVTVIR